VTQNIFSTRVLIKFLLLPVFGIPVGAPVAMGDEGASPAYAPGSMSGKRSTSFLFLDS